MDFPDLLNRLAVALACGLLVGVERHWRERDAAPGTRTAGVRSFAIIGLLGALLAASATGAGPVALAILLGLGLAAMTAGLIAFGLREAAEHHDNSATRLLAAQATFMIGAIAVVGDRRLAGAAAVGLTALLAMRGLLHGFVRQLSWPELRSAVLLLSMTFVALPLVPNQPIQVLLGLNPAQVWRFAIVLATVSFAGYVALRLFGEKRGRILAGAMTGLVSSTAAALTLAREAKRGVATAEPLVAGALAAGATAWLRTGALAWWVSPAMARPLLAPLIAGAVVQAGAAYVLMRKGQGMRAASQPANPFRLLSVLKLALLLAVIGVAAGFAARYLGGAGLNAVAIASALADVDAVVLSMGGLTRGTISPGLAAQTVAVAILANTIAKMVYAQLLGTRDYALRFGGVSAAALLAGLLAMLIR